MEDLSDEAGFQQLGKFFSDSTMHVFCEATKGLFDRLCALDDIEFVLGDVPWDAWHISWFLGEDVPILTEELDERTFLFGRKISEDLRGLGRVLGMDLDLLGVLGQLER